MTDLMRWDPFREVVSLREAMDRLFEEGLWRPRSVLSRVETPATLALDVYETDEEVKVRASVPGVNAEDIDISVQGDVMTIRGETVEEKEEQEGSYHMRERRYGAFQRSIRLPSTVKAGEAEASFKSGVLTVTLPKAEEAKTKSIEVKIEE